MKKTIFAILIPIIAGAGVFSSIQIFGVNDLEKEAFLAQNNNVINEDELSKQRKVPGLMMFIADNDKRSVSISSLRSAKSISEFIPNYPSSWISDYNSVVIKLVNENGQRYFEGQNSDLTSDQKQLLFEAEISNHLELEVNCQTENTVNHQIESRTMNVNLVVVPDYQAKYVGGNDSLMSELDNRTKSFIDFEKFKGLAFSFVINKRGEVQNVQITESSGNKELDDKFEKVINTLPEWIPAKNESGEFVDQKFQFKVFSSLSEMGC